ncbi:hypothetical protein [Rubrimonas cliftonensis]|uniref:Mce-associated membrane protein n=1 Tax=Rubrimonas cliftonensis TaxID=89524 RepID=A0A1H4G914_9RHOB|nr:hypothetical protein [Rubrimonas cliftonensis]SEB05510.1 hypothetical protein SAMN05444370_1412 [Rubrimonas cliftonensis]
MPSSPTLLASLSPRARAAAQAAAAIAAAFAISVGLLVAAMEMKERRLGDADSATWPPTSLADAAAQPRALLGLALEQVYEAFGETAETAIYDRLARVAAGEALETLYLQKRDALVNAAFDGGTQRVDHVDVTEAEAAVEGGLVSVAGRWRVVGAVGHEDHRHIRGAVYTARVDFALGPEGWRMVAFDLRDIDRQAVGEPLDP